MSDYIKIEDLSNRDADQLLKNITNIMQIAESLLMESNAPRAFAMYKLARDSRDILTFDATSRDVVQRLSRSDTVVHIPAGSIKVPDKLMQYIRDNRDRKIDCIKQARTVLGLGLKEGKDLVETINGV